MRELTVVVSKSKSEGEAGALGSLHNSDCQPPSYPKSMTIERIKSGGSKSEQERGRRAMNQSQERERSRRNATMTRPPAKSESESEMQ